MLHERLREAVDAARLGSRPLAVLFLDLDQFKRIDDSLGHRIGDLVLQGAAERLQSSLRNHDYISPRPAGQPPAPGPVGATGR